MIRGLSAPDRVEPVVIDAATLKANLAAEFDASNPSAEIAKSERVLKLLGLLGPSASLEQVYLELQDSQVIGYYDPKVKELFLVSRDGALGAVEEVTYAHEFTHELQDRRFDLNSLGLDTIKDDSDRALALLALVEGDAVTTQTAWMTANLSAAQLGEVVAESSDPAMLEVLARTPRILLETSLFPYQAGATFVGTLRGPGGQRGRRRGVRESPGLDSADSPSGRLCRGHEARRRHLARHPGRDLRKRVVDRYVGYVRRTPDPSLAPRGRRDRRRRPDRGRGLGR